MTTSYQRILVPVDGSAPSARALDEALKLAASQQAIVRVVHALEDFPAMAGIMPANIDQLQEDWRKNAARVLAEAEHQAAAAGVAVDSRLHGPDGRSPAEVILAEAADWRADLIVIGTHGYHGLARMFLGSVAESVVRRASVPVLLLRG